MNVGPVNKAPNYAPNYHPTRRGGGRNAAAPQVPLTSSPYALVLMGRTVGHTSPSMWLITPNLAYP